MNEEGLDRFLESYLLRERISGWIEERNFATELRDFLCEKISCDSSKIHEIDVITWEEKYCSIMNVERDLVKCSILPPYEEEDIISGILTDEMKQCSDKILLISTTDQPDNIWILYNEAVERGAKAVVFYDYYPWRRRRIVISGKWSYGFNDPIEVSIPAVHIPLEYYPFMKRYIGRRIELHIASSVRSSKGYNVEVVKEGSRGEVVVSAHHDAWLKGFRDNAVGVLTLIRLAEMIRKKSIRNKIKIISFTAEEFGDPRNPAWYWAYGSRVYLDRIPEEDFVRNRSLGLVLDVAYKEPLKISFTVPDIAYSFKDAISLESYVEGFGHVYMDSISFIRRGVPALTLHNFSTDIYPVYHTDLDIPSDSWRGFIERFSKNILKAIDHYNPREHLRITLFIEEIQRNLIRELKDPLMKILERLSDDEVIYKFYMYFSRLFLKPIALEGYRKLYSDLSLVSYPDLASMIYRGLISQKITIAGEEKIIDPTDKISRENLVRENLLLLEELERNIFK
ncbi:MAG: M28 family peptidase [Sulfolobales archaeon]